jgi:hypothetical protein
MGQPPGHRFCHVAVVHNESMYVFGGYDGSNRLNDFVEFHFGLDLMACDVPAGTLIGRYAGLLRPGSAADFGTGMYRFDLPEKFNPKELRRFADLVAADWTAAEPSVSTPPREREPPKTPEKNKKAVAVRVPPKTPETPAKKKLVAGGLNTPALTPKVTKKAIKKGK